VVVPACIPTSSGLGFLFPPASLPTHVGGGVFDDGYSNRAVFVFDFIYVLFYVYVY
jgi:hypothetical protein